ncbi:MAG: TIGR03960 family B12-binding radical SAM protein, partial [Planctomycetes bacterium]|nr:TIGR03960 family B12-binding radical SAM protein [Planctomycetota bacterium]
DAYEIGMSHLGLRILYALLNRDPELFAERVYCPFPDLERALREAGLPLFSLETRTRLADFDVVGFSLQSELTITNVLTMLELGGIALGRCERAETSPLVIAGGPVVFNPEPASDFFDAVLVGDGEEALPRLLHRDADLRAAGVGRAERLACLAREVEGLYVPALYGTRTDVRTGRIHVAPAGAAPLPVRKALVADLEPYPFPAETPVPRAAVLHDRVSVEIARGCTEGCRFCQAGIVYRPVRERTPRSIVNTVLAGLERSGFDEASLTALSTADYSCLTPLARALMAELAPRRTALSVSSLRVYGVTEALAREIARVRKTGFTIAPEAGTQRLRDVINKGVTDVDIATAAEIAFTSGWNRIKLYFMIGLPTETDSDVLAIAETAVRVHEIGRRFGPRGVRVVVSVSSFVPKASAAFQWAAFDGVANLERKQALLREQLRRRRGIELKCHDARMSRVEAILSRGDRRLGRVIAHAWRHGARFDEWSDGFSAARWDEALAACALDPAPFLAALPVAEELVWDHIDSRVTKGHLARDFQRGLAARFVPPCEKPPAAGRGDVPREGGGTAKLVCYACGLDCDLQAIGRARNAAGEEARAMVAAATPADVAAGRGATVPFEPTPGPLHRFRVCYAKTGLARYLSHLEVARLIERAGNRARWPVAYTGGFHPHPRLAFGPALSVGVEGEAECFDVELTEDWDPEALQERLNATLHDGFRVRAVRRVAAKAPPIEAEVERQAFVIRLEAGAIGAAELEERLAQRRAAGRWPVTREQDRRTRTFDVLPMLVDSAVTCPDGTAEWRFTLAAHDGRWVKPRELVHALLGGWPAGTRITRLAMGRLVDGRFLQPMDAEAR